MKFKKLARLCFTAIILVAVSSYSQEIRLKKLENHIKNKNIEEAHLTRAQIREDGLSRAEKAYYGYLKANLFLLDNRDDLAYQEYIISQKKYTALDSLDKVAQINLELASLLIAIDGNNDYEPFLNAFLDYAVEKNNAAYLSQAYMQAGKSFYNVNPKISLHFFKQALQENLKTGDEIYRARIYQNLGATFACDEINQADSALQVYEKAFNLYKKNKQQDYAFYIYANKGVAYTKKKDYESAIFYFEKADSVAIKEFNAKNKEALYGYFATAYKEKGDYQKALEYLDKQKVYREILDETEQKKALKEINTKYKTEERIAENLNLKKIIYSISGLLFVIAIISFLSYKNLSKKRKIAEQEKLIETQKLEKTLKEQELHDIDLMVESQEKERQRIANELHDNLGSILATLKLNFQNLKRNESRKTSEEKLLYKKTDSLIEEAYQEVRNISHLKNLGVIGSEGLLVAVKKMAEKMSVLEKLKINVIPFGLTERLENATEILIFRMIQELCTNIIKHSEANEVNIYMTQHNQKEINIIIEDNGKGFNPKTSIKTEGIGLKSIEKKVEQLGGNFTIDSILTKGTAIIIDIPL